MHALLTSIQDTIVTIRFVDALFAALGIRSDLDKEEIVRDEGEFYIVHTATRNRFELSWWWSVVVSRSLVHIVLRGPSPSDLEGPDVEWFDLVYDPDQKGWILGYTPEIRDAVESEKTLKEKLLKMITMVRDLSDEGAHQALVTIADIFLHFDALTVS